MTLIQIWAVLNLLLAFNVPQYQVDKVQVILEKTAQPSAILAPVGVGGEGLPSVTRVTEPSVHIQVNGLDSPVSVAPNGCIKSAIPTCAVVQVSWVSNGTIDPGCGITATPYIGWAGNYGTNSGKEAQITGTTTIAIQCATNGGFISDSVNVVLQ